MTKVLYIVYYKNKYFSHNKDSLCLNFFHLLARNPNLENVSIYSNKFFHNFHLSESSFTCPGLQASGLMQRLQITCTINVWILTSDINWTSNVNTTDIQIITTCIQPIGYPVKIRNKLIQS